MQRWTNAFCRNIGRTEWKGLWLLYILGPEKLLWGIFKVRPEPGEGGEPCEDSEGECYRRERECNGRQLEPSWVPNDSNRPMCSSRVTLRERGRSWDPRAQWGLITWGLSGHCEILASVLIVMWGQWRSCDLIFIFKVLFQLFFEAETLEKVWKGWIG